MDSVWDDYVTADGTRVHVSTDGYRHAISQHGVTSQPDPHHSPADAAALERGDIDIVEYRRRYNRRAAQSR
ncbi:hypothetical protein [Streptomyces cyanogenus]|uniref:Uncharacterized protein n=1 Tax=Streptomyces cyanogenus TaxID=80860 RepID=A0ABX7TJV4_STRCY|nr:hypothetical protein [Streptomyces cyanogenus]QTD96947.1 hypothetical protein S1361_06260 [Streptomyces cyanogenus]